MKERSHLYLQRLISVLLVFSLMFTLILPAAAAEQGREIKPECGITVLSDPQEASVIEDTGILEAQNSLCTVIPQTSDSGTASGAARYTVLLLDVEGGFTMSVNDEPIYEVETPLETVREAALKFVEQVQSAGGTNYVAIVTYSSEATIDSGFSTDADDLSNVINGMQTREGFANINDAFLKAEELMSSVVDENALKNIVLFTQGVAGAGESTEEGPYSVDDCTWYVTATQIYMYEYSNAAYATAQRLMEQYNLYSVGLFQNFNRVPEEGKGLLNFSKRFAEDVQNCGFQDVDNINDLVFVFGELADTISAESLKQLYIDQHMKYAASEAYQEEIIAGYDIYLEAVLQDALSDSGVKGYNVLDAVNSWAQLDVELDDVDLYNLLLAELLYSEQSRNKLQELYNSNLSAQIVDTIQFIMDKLEDTGDVQEREKIEKLLDRLRKTEMGSSLYTDIYGELMDNLTEQYSFSQIKNSLLDMAFIADIGIDAVSQVASTTKELIAYATYGQAYMNTSDDFKDVLFNLYVVSEFYVDSDDFLDKLGAWDACVNVASFRAALQEFIVNMEKYENEGAKAVADFAVEAIKEGTGEFASDVTAKVMVQGLDMIFAHFPILNLIPAIKTGLEAGQLIIEITTNVDERAYSVDMLIKLYCMAYMMDYTVQEYADRLTEDDFAEAARFDEAVNVYKSVISIAADYGMQYEQELLAAENRKSSIYRSAKKASWYSTAMSTMAVEKLRLEDIQCHTTGLIYDHNTGEITYDDTKLKIFTIACPVEVTVATESGKQIAFLSDADSVIAGGYEHYFFTVALDDGSGEYIKIAIVPEDYEVTIGGTGTGVMNAFVADFADNALTNAVVFQDIPLTADTQGYFTAASDAEQQVLLTVDDTTHTGRHSHTYHPVFTWSEEYAACTATFICEECGDSKQTGCAVTKEVIPATTVEDGRYIYTAKVVFREEIHMDEIIIVIPAAVPDTIASGTCGENLTWTLDGAGLLTISGEGDMDDYIYDGSVDHESPWKDYRTQIYNAVIEDGVSSIGGYAFERCTSLTGITIPDSVTSIDSGAFEFCYRLASINIPDGVTSLGSYAFYQCKSLTSVTIPASVTRINMGAFSACDRLTKITVDVNNPHYSTGENGELLNKTKTVLMGVPGGIKGSYTVPGSVISIGDSALDGCSNLTSVTIPDSVTAIGAWAFEWCTNLSSITIPDSVTSIGYNAFSKCTSLTDVYYGGTEAQWEQISIDGDNLYLSGADIHFDSFAAEVASGWSGYTTWVLTDDGKLTFSGDGAMKNYEYKSEMPWYSYFDQITSVVIEEGVTSIGSYAFYGMGIESIEIPDTVTTIGDYAFKSCTALDGVVLPSGLTRLGESSFYGCTALTVIEIPASLWTIQPYTFKNCTSLASVSFHEGNLQKISDGAFYGTALRSLVLPDCLDILDVYTFKNCTALESIRLGSSLTELREAVFYGTAIPTITVPEGITRIGPYAFKNCVQLETIGLPTTLKSVGEASFYACTGLKTVNLPNAVTTIGNYAFRKCAAIKTLTLGSGLKTIGECSFYGCSGLTTVVIPDKVTTIKSYAFKTCTGLTSVTLGNSVVLIGEGAFNTCTGLKTIVFPDSVASLGDYCFSGSENLWKLTFQGDAPAIGTGAFKGLDAYVYYPGGNTTWTSDVMQGYGGTIVWKSL